MQGCCLAINSSNNWAGHSRSQQNIYDKVHNPDLHRQHTRHVNIIKNKIILYRSHRVAVNQREMTDSKMHLGLRFNTSFRTMHFGCDNYT